MVTNSDCVASDAGVCPSTCKTALQAAEDACNDKKWTYDADSSVKKWNDDAFTWYLYKVNAGRSALDKQDACDAVIHDFLIASVKTCVQGFTLAVTTSTDIDQLFYCTGGGGTDGSTCDDKCQAYIDIMDTTCDVGASYNAADADAKYDDQGTVMKVIEGDGPEGCKYVSTNVSPAGALRASLAVVSAVAAAVLVVALLTIPIKSKRAQAKSTPPRSLSSSSTRGAPLEPRVSSLFISAHRWRMSAATSPECAHNKRRPARAPFIVI